MNDYPYGLDVRPLTTWPGELTAAHKRQRSNFSAPLRNTQQILWRELRALGANRSVLEVAIPESQFRIDGRPRAQAKAEHPGVVLSLPTTNVGALRYATDIFTTWQDNLRAIALGLEALRKVDRYGITRRGEQYQGFKALPPGGSVIVPEQKMTVDEAAELLHALDWESVPQPAEPLDLRDARLLLEHPETLTAVWRHLVKKHHPDRGGDRATWDRLEQAKRVLDQHASGAA